MGGGRCHHSLQINTIQIEILVHRKPYLLFIVVNSKEVTHQQALLYAGHVEWPAKQLYQIIFTHLSDL
jgi:hypothetical protein